MKECVIVIPVYKEGLDSLEYVSLRRLFDLNICNNVCFICPEGLSLINYSKTYRFKYNVEYFDKSYFKSTLGYSKLCMSYDFYNRFSEYEYMLIYQLDCYLFRNEISDWCKRGYDYIGSPIFSENANWDVFKNGHYEPVVGNGGFSLRKISTFKELTNPEGDLLKYTHFTDPKFNNVAYEDLYFCDWLPSYYELNIAKWQDAVHFGLDMNPDVAYNIMKLFNEHETPMGIHAVGKNIRWWKNYIKELSNDTINEYEKKYKGFFKEYYNENTAITVKSRKQ